MDPVWIGGLAMLVPAAIAGALGRVVPPQMLQSHGARRASEAARLAAKRANEARAQLDQLQGDMAAAKNKIEAHQKKLAGLKKLRLEYVNERALVIHEIGRPARDSKAFQAFVMNRFAHEGVVNGPAAQINSLWASRHLVQVWADNAQDARVEMDSQYPRNQGFEVDFKGESSHLP